MTEKQLEALCAAIADGIIARDEAIERKQSELNWANFQNEKLNKELEELKKKEN